MLGRYGTMNERQVNICFFLFNRCKAGTKPFILSNPQLISHLSLQEKGGNTVTILVRQ